MQDSEMNEATPSHGINERLLVAGQWNGNPPTATEIREQIAHSKSYASGQVMAAAYIAHAMADPNNEYDWRDLWSRTTRTKLSTWIGRVKDYSDKWSIWWWRQCAWPLWSNHRQWLFYYGAATFMYVHLDKEIDSDITCLYPWHKKWYAAYVPVKHPTPPQETSRFVWGGGMDKWKEIKLVSKQRMHFDKGGFMTRGVRGKYYTVHLNRGLPVVLSSKQIAALMYPEGKLLGYRLVRSPATPRWIAAITNKGVALCATRQKTSIISRLEEHESI